MNVNTITYAFDYETYYDKECTVKELGPWHYARHPKFDAYLLSVVGDNGFEWVGHPTEFEWTRFEGANLLSHNATFESSVTTRLVELNLIPTVRWANLFDTADLAAYLGFPRSLAEAAAHMLGIAADKTMRDKAKGKYWFAMDEEFQEQMKKYALTDSRVTLRLFLEYGHLWPEWERELSRRTREMCIRGMPAVAANIKRAVRSLDNKLLNARSIIPWVKSPDDPVLSLKKAAMEARKHGIIPPSSFAKDSPEFEAWVENHGEQFPWAKALGEYRSINMLQKKIETLNIRTDPKTDTFYFGLKYFGAHTGRDSGDGGFNVQNPPRQAMFGVDLRALMMHAPKGKKLVIADESAIEPRVLSCLSGDEELRSKLAEGMDPYEAQARISGAYDDPRPLKEVDYTLRQFKKVEVLGLGYGAGAEKAQIITKQWTGMEISLERAEELVAGFRSRKYIPDLWKSLEESCRSAAPKNWECELPSGRVLTYRDVKNFGSLSAVIPRLGKMMRVKLWGGSLTENITQACARDIFMWHVLEIGNAGYEKQILLRSHDEVVTLVDEDTAEDDLNKILTIMRTAPPWMPDFPAAAEGGLSDVYCKL